MQKPVWAFFRRKIICGYSLKLFFDSYCYLNHVPLKLKPFKYLLFRKIKTGMLRLGHTIQ